MSPLSSNSGGQVQTTATRAAARFVAGSHWHPRGSARIFRPGTATSPGPSPFQTRRTGGNELYLRKLLCAFVLGKFVSPPPPSETNSAKGNKSTAGKPPPQDNPPDQPTPLPY